MRKVILAVAVSLDGKIEGPKGEFDWCFTDQDYGMSEFLNGIDTILFGRKSYDLVVRMDESGEFKDPWIGYNNFVFSKTLTQVKEGYSLISDDISGFIKDLRSKEGKDIWLFGGAILTSSFIEIGLLDEIWLAVHPLLLGPGKPIFSNLMGRLPLNLIDSQVYSTGLISLRYAVN
jgi:dihydrofolate reductase